MSSTLATVIIGAGISGLSAAYALAKTGQPVILLEASGRVGGVIQTVNEEGFTWEAGPNTLSSTAASLLSLCEQLGIVPIQANPAAKNRYIYHAGELRPAPHDLISFINTPLLSAGAKLTLLSEGFKPRQGAGSDESVAGWATRRLGAEVLNTLLGPFLSGIYAGDPAQLSMAATLPKLAGWEADYGSLTAGAMSSMFKPKKRSAPPRYKGLQVLTLAGGLQALTDALEQAIIRSGGTVRLNTAAMRLDRDLNGVEPGYQIVLSTGESLKANRVIVATDTLGAARLLENIVPPVSQALQEIPYAAMAGVHLGIPRIQIPHALDGFGCLLPRSEGLTVLGSIWVSSLFSDRAPAGQSLFSNFIGGATNPEVAGWSDERCVETVLADLQTILGATAPPLIPSYVRVVRWARAIPQYMLGHRDRLARIEQGLQDTPGVYLLGNYLRGVSLNHCADEALKLSKQVRMGPGPD